MVLVILVIIIIITIEGLGVCREIEAANNHKHERRAKDASSNGGEKCLRNGCLATSIASGVSSGEAPERLESFFETSP